MYKKVFKCIIYTKYKIKNSKEKKVKGMNYTLQSKIVLILMISNVLLAIDTTSLVVASDSNEWTPFELKGSNSKTLTVFYNDVSSEGIPSDVEINVSSIKNAELLIKTYPSSTHHPEIISYNNPGNYTYSNVTTMLQFDLLIPNTDTEYYVDHNSSSKFTYRLKSASTDLPSDVIVNVWKEVSLQSLGPKIIKVFDSNNEHNLTVQVQLSKIVNGSFNIGHAKSDTVQSIEINDFDNYSYNFVSHRVSLEIDPNSTNGLIQGQYKITDNGTVGPVIPGFEFWIVLSIGILYYYNKRKNGRIS